VIGRKHKAYFGGTTKAVDGVIATFELDGERFSRHFYQVLHTKEFTDDCGKRVRTVSKQPIESPNRQVIDYCDKTGAKVVCISSPETIMRDLQGSRADLKQRPHQKHRQNSIQLPELNMLAGRNDVLLSKSRPERNSQ
jgi:hypothetical protein